MLSDQRRERGRNSARPRLDEAHVGAPLLPTPVTTACGREYHHERGTDGIDPRGQGPQEEPEAALHGASGIRPPAEGGEGERKRTRSRAPASPVDASRNERAPERRRDRTSVPLATRDVLGSDRTHRDAMPNASLARRLPRPRLRPPLPRRRRRLRGREGRPRPRPRLHRRRRNPPQGNRRPPRLRRGLRRSLSRPPRPSQRPPPLHPRPSRRRRLRPPRPNPRSRRRPRLRLRPSRSQRRQPPPACACFQAPRSFPEGTPSRSCGAFVPQAEPEACVLRRGG